MPPADPTIALQIGGRAGTAAAGPLNVLSKFATIQSTLTANQLRLQQLQARRAIGQIAATSGGDPNKIMQGILSNPIASPYAGEFINYLKNWEKTGAELANIRQKGQMDAVSFALKMVAPGSRDPGALPGQRAAALAGISPEYRGAAENAINAFEASLIANTSLDPDVAARQRIARGAAAGYASGLSPEAVASFAGTSIDITRMNPATGLAETGGGVREPPAYGGARIPFGPTYPAGLTASEAATPESGPIGEGGKPSTVTRQQLATGKVKGVPALVPGGAAGAANPLAPPGGPVGFQSKLAPGQEDIIKGLSANYKEEGAKTYASAEAGLASLQVMRNSFDKLKEGGWLSPGSGAEARFNFAKWINTAVQVTNPKGEAPFDPEKIGTWEQLYKESQRAGMQLVNQMFGAQRESVLIYQAAASAVPRIQNTPLGAEMIMNSLEAVMQRQVDLRNWETNWTREHAGDLTGAQEAFNQKFDPRLYVDRAHSLLRTARGDYPDAIPVSSAAEAAKYLPGTIVKRKGDGKIFRVTPQISKVVPPKLGGG